MRLLKFFVTHLEMLMNMKVAFSISSAIVSLLCWKNSLTKRQWKKQVCGINKPYNQKRIRKNFFQSTFHYRSNYWSNTTEYNTAGGETGFDLQETKLPSYWNTSFSKICLGMKIGERIRFIVINMKASSLYSLIADGKHRRTSLGRETWKKLIGLEASLQNNCNREGFNAKSGGLLFAKARIGIVSNNENHCFYSDSRIGFGTGGDQDDNNTCGNEASYHPDNGDKHIKAMGYILVH